MKKTLLEIVQDIMSDMDTEDVSTISELDESMQIARIVRQTFFNIAATRKTPEHRDLFQLTAASDSAKPTNFTLGNNVKVVDNIWYQDSTGKYTEIGFLDKLEFLKRTDGVSDNYQTVDVGSTNVRVRNNKHPEYYTSFDDETIIMDSFDNSVDATLQASKVRAYGELLPTFSLTDGHVPDLDVSLFPYLISESKAMAFDIKKGGVPGKVEQTARRARTAARNDYYKIGKYNGLPDYGR